MKKVLRGLSYNRACDVLAVNWIVNDDVEIKHNSVHDITIFKMSGVVVARYVERLGRLEYRG